MDIYYVYAYVREDGTPYYIGKGKGRRAYSNQHSINLPIDKSRIVFIFKELSENDAHKLECLLIEFHGRKNNGTGILRNMTDGGEGTSGYKHTDKTKQIMKDKIHSKETKQKISQSRKGKPSPTKGKPSPYKGKKRSEEFKQKRSEATKGKNNPMFGKSRTEEQKLKQSKALKGRPSPHKGKIRGPQKNPKLPGYKKNTSNDVIQATVQSF